MPSPASTRTALSASSSTTARRIGTTHNGSYEALRTNVPDIVPRLRLPGMAACCQSTRQRRFAHQLSPVSIRFNGRVDQDFFTRAGGEQTFRTLVSRFYDGVAMDPLLRPLYPEQDLGPAAERLTLFLIQYWGGPRTYSERRGHPRLRMRHAPFAASAPAIATARCGSPAESGRTTSGTLTPLRLEITPPSTTSVSAKSLPQDFTFSRRWPSSTSNAAPGFKDARAFEFEVDAGHGVGVDAQVDRQLRDLDAVHRPHS